MTFKHILNFPVEAGEMEPAAHVHLVSHISESGFSRAKMGDWSSHISKAENLEVDPKWSAQNWWQSQEPEW